MVYVVAGGIGLLLLILRMRLVEPALFEKISRSINHCGSLQLLANPCQALDFFFCVMLGFSLIYTWSLLNFFSVEFSRALMADGQNFEQKFCLMVFYLGTSCGDIVGGALSQILRSRRKAIAILMSIGAASSLSYLLLGPHFKLTTAEFYLIYFVIGFSAGGWILVSMVAAEQFGTNIRATTATVITNSIRGFTVPMLLAFQGLCQIMSISNAAALMGVVLYALSFFALFRLRETHGLDLDYVERPVKSNVP
jgi:putative MFS transporter